MHCQIFIVSWITPFNMQNLYCYSHIFQDNVNRYFYSGICWFIGRYDNWKNISSHYIFSLISGTALNKSATSPRSATWKIGASASLLIATIVFESFMPAKCWIAPEIPTAIYRSYRMKKVVISKQNVCPKGSNYKPLKQQLD